MTTLAVGVEGIGFWAPGLRDWASASAMLCGARTDRDEADDALRPTATVLPPAERRRASASVLLACEVAEQACAMAGRDAAVLTSVFASTHGDPAITDYLCRTLAENPHELSPTRFHNSVHNAPAGYWTIANGCHAPSTAISASHASFSAGLLEAATQVLCDEVPVLLVAYDITSSGPMTDVSPSALSFGTALVLVPVANTPALAIMRIRLDADPASPTAAPSQLAALADSNPTAAGSLALLAALAAEGPSRVTLANAGGPAVAIEVRR